MKTKLFSVILLISFGLIALRGINAQTTTTQAQQEQNKEQDKNIVSSVISWYNDNLNYGTITLLMAVESSFIPFPSEVVIPPAAYKALDESNSLNIVLVVIFGTLGAMIGALVNYFLALIIGRPIIYKFADTKLAHFLLINKEKVQTAENYFVKHGKASTFYGRLVPVVRQLISLPAGIAKMNLLTFSFFTFLGAVIWNSVLAVLGYIAKGQQGLIEKYSNELSYAILAVAALFILYLIYNGLKKNKSDKSENKVQ